MAETLANHQESMIEKLNVKHRIKSPSPTGYTKFQSSAVLSTSAYAYLQLQVHLDPSRLHVFTIYASQYEPWMNVNFSEIKTPIKVINNCWVTKIKPRDPPIQGTGKSLFFSWLEVHGVIMKPKKVRLPQQPTSTSGYNMFLDVFGSTFL